MQHYFWHLWVNQKMARRYIPENHSYYEMASNTLTIPRRDCKSHKYSPLNPKLQLNISSGLLPFFHRSLEKFLFCFYFYFLNFVFILFCFCFSLLFRVIVSVAMVQGHWSFLLKCLSFYWFHAVTFLFSISPMSLMSIFILFVNGCFKVLVI